MPGARATASATLYLGLIASCLAANCGAPERREQPASARLDAARPEPIAVEPATASVRRAETEWLSKWSPPAVKLEVSLSNTPASPAWFVIRQQFTSPPMEPGDLQTRRQVTLYPNLLGGDRARASELRAIELCVDDEGCDYAVYLPAGYGLSYVETFWRPTPTTESKYFLDVWRLAELRFDDEPAETWTAEELTPDFWSEPTREHPWPIEQLDLEVAQRWDVSFAVPRL